MEVVPAMSTAAWPAEFSKKIPGPWLAKGTVTGALVTPPLVTVNGTCDGPLNCHGTWKLICVGYTPNKGAAMPPISTVTPAVEVPKPLPKTAAMLPGARGAAAAKLAPLRTPPLLATSYRSLDV